MEIKPSNIFYSHDTIMYRFQKRGGGDPIGKLLDGLCEGNKKVGYISTITIVKKDGKWFTLDNRRLWVLHHYEAFLKAQGKSLTVHVRVETYNEAQHRRKFTTGNGGVSVRIKGGEDPTGNWYKKLVPVTPVVEEEKNNEPVSEEDHNTSDDIESEVKNTHNQADENINDDKPELKNPFGLIVSEIKEQNGIISVNNDDLLESNSTNGINNVKPPGINVTNTTNETRCIGSVTTEEIPQKIDVADNATLDKKDTGDPSNSQITEEQVSSAISDVKDNAIEGELLATDEDIESHETVAKEEETKDEVKPSIKRSFSQLENTESEQYEILYKRQKSEDN